MWKSFQLKFCKVNLQAAEFLEILVIKILKISIFLSKVGFATIMVLFLGTERRTPTPPDRHGCVSRSTGRYDDESRFQAHNRCNIIYSSQLT